MNDSTQKLFLGMLLTLTVNACPVLNSAHQIVPNLGDPVFELLTSSDECPQNVIEFRSRWVAEGAHFTSTMVANRGFHNPRLGSFSFFEMVEVSSPKTLTRPVTKEEVFFGHFTSPGANGTLTLDQTPNQRSLMIELIAWDRKTKLYNFYELMGSPQGPRWFYRGNSADIWSDISKLHLNKTNTNPLFGQTLRCSGCHLSGGPIMKEFAMPHDSWWSKERPLPFGGLAPDPSVREVMQSLQSPTHLSHGVAAGLSKLLDSKTQQQLPLPIALRPLFCPEELQLQSSPNPLAGPEKELIIPLGFFLDERWGAQQVTSASKEDYLSALKTLGSRFPETNEIDGDHPWNTPVKANSDVTAVERLVGHLIDKEFVADVLAVDFHRPLFSKKRCELLRLVPEKANPAWLSDFKENLKKSPLSHAHELLENLTNPMKSAEQHTKQAQHFIEQCRNRLQTKEGVLALVSYLGQVRAESFASDISKNPLGQILEPGFRVIFPQLRTAPTPWRLTLNNDCMPVENANH